MQGTLSPLEVEQDTTSPPPIKRIWMRMRISELSTDRQGPGIGLGLKLLCSVALLDDLCNGQDECDPADSSWPVSGAWSKRSPRPSEPPNRIAVVLTLPNGSVPKGRFGDCCVTACESQWGRFHLFLNTTQEFGQGEIIHQARPQSHQTRNDTQLAHPVQQQHRFSEGCYKLNGGEFNWPWPPNKTKGLWRADLVIQERCIYLHFMRLCPPYRTRDTLLIQGQSWIFWILH